MQEHTTNNAETIALAINALGPTKMYESPTYGELCNEIAHLIERDFNRLVNILYRMDVSEEKIRIALSAAPGRDAAELIADLVLERQSEKIRTRHLFNVDEDIPDEDKW
jgi:hypothetical protein